MATENVITITKDNFDQEVLKSTKPVLLDFWAPWCAPCKMIAPVIDEVADAKAGQAVVGKVNVDDNQELAVRFRVNGIPALLFFKDGQVVDQIQGGRTTRATLISKLDAIA